MPKRKGLKYNKSVVAHGKKGTRAEGNTKVVSAEAYSKTALRNKLKRKAGKNYIVEKFTIGRK